MGSNKPLNFSAMATNAKLAEFSYANLDRVANWSDKDTIIEQLKKDLEIDDKFAQAFVDSYQVVAHQPNTDSGFSATAVRDKETGYATVICRGTEMSEPNDLAADAQIALGNGIPIGQMIDMRNFIERLQTPKGQPIKEAYYDYQESFKDKKEDEQKEPHEYIKFRINQDKGMQGLGVLKPGEKITATGHSLGLNLCMGGGRMYPELIEAVYGYNGAGFGSEGNIKPFFDKLAQKDTHFNPSEYVDVYGHDGVRMIANDCLMAA